MFSAEMVRAILDGRKTQTRRIVKPPAGYTILPTRALEKWVSAYGDDRGFRCSVGKFNVWSERFYCPYGKPGDRLWVRESFYYDHVDGLPASAEAIDRDMLYYPADARRAGAWCCQLIPECCCGEVGKPRVRSGRHMPRRASRLTLEITDVRVQRVRGISEADAKAEGGPDILGYREHGWANYRAWYRDVWNKINGPKSWDENPWVWALTFRVVS